MDARKKVEYLLGFNKDINHVPKYLQKDIQLYGMGKERKVDDYMEFIKGDFCPKYNKILATMLPISSSTFLLKDHKKFIFATLLIILSILCYIIYMYKYRFLQ